MWVFSWLGVFFAALSIASLLIQGLEESWIAPLQSMFDYYHDTLTAMFGWLGPVAQWIVDFVKLWAPDFVIRLRPDWIHAPVLAALLAGATFRVTTFGGYTLEQRDWANLKSSVGNALIVFMLLLVLCTFSFQEAPTKAGPVTQWVQLHFDIGPAAVGSLFAVYNYAVFALSIVIHLLALFSVLWFFTPPSDPQLGAKPALLGMIGFVAGRFLAWTFGPLGGAILFVMSNAGLKYIGVQ
jgi:hypothetical protein